MIFSKVFDTIQGCMYNQYILVHPQNEHSKLFFDIYANYGKISFYDGLDPEPFPVFGFTMTFDPKIKFDLELLRIEWRHLINMGWRRHEHNF